jgi:hypothetical protein
MEDKLKLIADIASNSGFGIFTIMLAYFNIQTANTKISELEKIKKQEKYNKISSFFLVIVSICFISSVIIKVFIYLNY